jgi:hypothetical protein
MRLGKILVLMLVMSVVGFSAQSWYENFQGYAYPTDAGMTTKFLVFNNSMLVGQSIVQSPLDSLTWHVTQTSQLTAGTVVIQLNESMVNTTTETGWTFEYLLKNGTSWKVAQNGEDDWYFYFDTNHSNANRLKNFTNSHGYLLKVNFSAVSQTATNTSVKVELSRCSNNMTFYTTITGTWSCPQVLSSATFNTMDDTGINVTGGFNVNWYQTWSLFKDIRVKLSQDTDGTVRFYLNPVTSADTLRFSYLDEAPLFNNGSLIMGFFSSVGYSGGGLDLYIDDMMYSNFTSEVSSNQVIPVSYPYFQSYNFTLVERSNNTLASWVALNQPFAYQFTFNTPVGITNAITEITCPVKLFGEYSIKKPQITFKARDGASNNACVITYEFSIYNYYTGYVPILCANLQPPFCLFTWNTKEENKSLASEPIIYELWSGGGDWSTAYKRMGMSDDKYFYTSVNLACSAPANLSMGVEYYDVNSCSSPQIGVPTLVGDKAVYVYNFTVGVNPDTNETCDVQLNSTCWNGSTGTPAEGAPYECDDPTLCGTPTCGDGYCASTESYATCPTDCPQTGAEGAGITDSFDQSQVGGIASALMTPAFIGIIICLALAMVGAVYGGQLIGAMGFIGGFVFMTWFGLFPLWVGLSIIVMASFATVYLVRDIFTGE